MANPDSRFKGRSVDLLQSVRRMSNNGCTKVYGAACQPRPFWGNFYGRDARTLSSLPTIECDFADLALVDQEAWFQTFVAVTPPRFVTFAGSPFHCGTFRWFSVFSFRLRPGERGARSEISHFKLGTLTTLFLGRIGSPSYVDRSPKRLTTEARRKLHGEDRRERR